MSRHSESASVPPGGMSTAPTIVRLCPNLNSPLSMPAAYALRSSASRRFPRRGTLGSGGSSHCSLPSGGAPTGQPDNRSEYRSGPHFRQPLDEQHRPAWQARYCTRRLTADAAPQHAPIAWRPAPPSHASGMRAGFGVSHDTSTAAIALMGTTAARECVPAPCPGALRLEKLVEPDSN